MMNFYTTSDAIAEESSSESRKSRISGRATEAKLMGRRSKTVFVGQVESIESVMPVRERRDLTEMNDFESFMGEERKKPLTFVVGKAAALETTPVARKPLPTARVFKLGFKPGKSGKRWVEYLRYCD